MSVQTPSYLSEKDGAPSVEAVKEKELEMDAVVDHLVRRLSENGLMLSQPSSSVASPTDFLLNRSLLSPAHSHLKILIDDEEGTNDPIETRTSPTKPASDISSTVLPASFSSSVAQKTIHDTTQQSFSNRVSSVYNTSGSARSEARFMPLPPLSHGQKTLVQRLLKRSQLEAQETSSIAFSHIDVDGDQETEKDEDGDFSPMDSLEASRVYQMLPKSKCSVKPTLGQDQSHTVRNTLQSNMSFPRRDPTTMSSTDEVYLFADDTSMSVSLVDLVDAMDQGRKAASGVTSTYSAFAAEDEDLLEVISNLNEV